MFIGKLIPGEQYETHDGYILTLQDVNEFYCSAWKHKRDTCDGDVFTIMTTSDIRRKVRDIT